MSISIILALLFDALFLGIMLIAMMVYRHQIHECIKPHWLLLQKHEDWEVLNHDHEISQEPSAGKTAKNESVHIVDKNKTSEISEASAKETAETTVEVKPGLSLYSNRYLMWFAILILAFLCGVLNGSALGNLAAQRTNNKNFVRETQLKLAEALQENAGDASQKKDSCSMKAGDFFSEERAAAGLPKETRKAVKNAVKQAQAKLHQDVVKLSKLVDKLMKKQSEEIPTATPCITPVYFPETDATKGAQKNNVPKVFEETTHESAHSWSRSQQLSQHTDEEEGMEHYSGTQSSLKIQDTPSMAYHMLPNGRYSFDIKAVAHETRNSLVDLEVDDTGNGSSDASPSDSESIPDPDTSSEATDGDARLNYEITDEIVMKILMTMPSHEIDAFCNENVVEDNREACRELENMF